MRSYFDSMLRYFEFSGRSTRRQYWLFWLVTTLLCLAAVFADYQLYGIRPTATNHGPFTVFASIIHVVPGITVTVRRLHDTGRSGWFYFIQLIPVIGSLILLYWMVRGPEQWDNLYGSDPRDEMEGQWSAPSPRSTIPRQIRMGNSQHSRPAHLAQREEIQRFI